MEIWRSIVNVEETKGPRGGSLYRFTLGCGHTIIRRRPLKVPLKAQLRCWECYAAELRKIRFPRKWESIDHYTQRLKVFEGWVVKHKEINLFAMCFVPDPEHKWELGAWK